MQRRPVTIQEILGWADLHRHATGEWPTQYSGSVLGGLGENWKALDNALRKGLRTLAGGSSLACLLAEQRGVRHMHALPPLTVEQILQWADEHQQRTGAWPIPRSGKIPNSHGETWLGVHNALRQAGRGLPGGSTLPQLLAEHRGVRNLGQLPALTQEQILQWADAHHDRTGAWPTEESGGHPRFSRRLLEGGGQALRKGRRQLPAGSSLARLLNQQRGVSNLADRPALSVEQILAWADAFHEQTGTWPTLLSGPIPAAPQETWLAVDMALRHHQRGLQEGGSLACLLAEKRGKRHHLARPHLSRRQIIEWAKVHFQRTGQWPTRTSGPIAEAPDETWHAVDAAMGQGGRGLRGRSSLADLLQEHVGRRNQMNLPPLSYRKILAWAEAHHQRTGSWPKRSCGPVVEAPGERWDYIDTALQQGLRQLPGGSSLPKLLARKKGVRNLGQLPAFTLEQILHWADLHFQRSGAWPKNLSGPIADAPGETWLAVDNALRKGRRGLSGGTSLAQLLRQNGRGPVRRS